MRRERLYVSVVIIPGSLGHCICVHRGNISAVAGLEPDTPGLWVNDTGNELSWRKINTWGLIIIFISVYTVYMFVNKILWSTSNKISIRERASRDFLYKNNLFPSELSAWIHIVPLKQQGAKSIFDWKVTRSATMCHVALAHCWSNVIV